MPNLTSLSHTACASIHSKPLMTWLPALSPPTSHIVAMPAFAVEAKSIEKSTIHVELQCAYDGAIMVDAAQKYTRIPGQRFRIFLDDPRMTTLANHAVESTSRVQRHSYPLFSDTPNSLENARSTA
jgi:hypothetical protein